MLDTYDLGENDVIFVDAGEHLLTQNIVIEAQDAGVTIRGSTDATHPTVINRNDATAAAFELIGLTPQVTDDWGLTLEHLYITGADTGILADRDQGNERIRITDSTIADNDRYGIIFEDVMSISN